eukprot:1147898-Pelagomonas_calceolata.AAC.5
MVFMNRFQEYAVLTFFEHCAGLAKHHLFVATTTPNLGTRLLPPVDNSILAALVGRCSESMPDPTAQRL